MKSATEYKVRQLQRGVDSYNRDGGMPPKIYLRGDPEHFSVVAIHKTLTFAIVFETPAKTIATIDPEDIAAVVVDAFATCEPSE